MRRLALAVLLLASIVPAQNLLVAAQPKLSLRPNESACVTVRTLPTTAGVTIQPSFTASFVNVMPASAVTGAGGDVTFTVHSVAVHLIGTTVAFSDTGSIFAATQTNVVCDHAKLTLQGTAGSYPGTFALELAADPGVSPAVLGAIFLSPTPGTVPLVLFNPADPRSLGVGPVGLVLPTPFAGPFFPPFEAFVPPSFPMPVLPAPATIYAHGAVLDLSGGALFNRISQPEPVYLAPASSFSNRNRQMGMVRSFFPIVERADQSMMALGGGSGGIFAQIATDQCDVYDPRTDSWSTSANKMTAPRSLHTATRLHDGRYLIVGGVDDLNDPQDSAEIYDPASDTFTPVGTMSSPRVGHSATLLANGDVLIAGGLSIIGGAGLAGVITTINSTLDSTEYLTLAASGCGGTLSPGPDMQRPRAGHGVVALDDGRFYFMGGVGWTTFIGRIPTIWQETEFFNGTSFQGGPNMPTARALSSIAQIGTSPDEFLLAGGLNSVLGSGAPTDRADRYTASPNQPGSWARAGTMTSVRGLQTAYVFGDDVIQIGGIKGDLVNPESLITTEIYKISTGAWRAGPNLSTERGAYGWYRNKYGVVHIIGGAAGPGISPQVSDTTEWYYR